MSPSSNHPKRLSLSAGPADAEVEAAAAAAADSAERDGSGGQSAEEDSCSCSWVEGHPAEGVTWRRAKDRRERMDEGVPE